VNYRSVASMNRDILSWLERLPRGLELIVGIPRSGLFIANLLALYLDLPLTDVDGLITGRVIESGPVRGRAGQLDGLFSTNRKVLVVDDSLSSGSSMRKVRERIAAAELPHKILYSAVYIVPGRETEVDYYCDVLPHPRILEWNFRNNSWLQHACMDIDGVLCRDPTEHENDDGPRYRRFIQKVPPKIIPSVAIGWLVTCRLEKYRTLTEHWLEKHGIKYRELVMMDYPDMEARRAAGSYGTFKGTVYKATNAELFIESSLRQAFEIAHISGRDVLCMETMEMVRSGAVISRLPTTPSASGGLAHDSVRRLLRFARRLVKK